MPDSRKRRFLAALVLQTTVATPLFAWEYTAPYPLDSVVVQADLPFSEAGAGSRISTIHESVLAANRTQSLSELLSGNSLLYIKSRGQGGLSTSSFRGTSSNHTQVSWNGIVINPTLSGGFDFSQIPAFFCDRVSLCHGNGYLKNGTGALGGSISLENTPQWGRTGISADVLGEYGSNETVSGGLSFRAAGERWISRTRVYHQQSENDFRYLNKVLYVTRPFYERRKDAAYRQTGVMQEFYYRWDEHRRLSVNGWWISHANDLPQPVIVVSSNKMKERQHTDDVRALLRYEQEKGRHAFAVSAAWIYDRMRYRKWNRYDANRSRNDANSLVAKGDYRRRLSASLLLHGGVQYRYDRAESDHYTGSRSRHSASLSAGAEWRPVERLTLDLQGMGEQVNRRFMPTFSAGAGYALVENRLDLKATVARNYHYPTLNDRYWYPGGNPDLKPEQGFAYDVTIDFRPRIGLFYGRFTASYYRQEVTDWIVWTPVAGSIWRPKNLKQVRSQGVELSGEISCTSGSWQHRLFLNGAYASAENRTRAFAQDNSLHKQLPYIPRYKGNGRYSVSWRRFSAAYSVAYTGRRYTSTDEAYSTDAYWQHDAEISYRQPLGHARSVTFRLRADNLFDHYIESTQYYPMPLRCFYGSLSFNL